MTKTKTEKILKITNNDIEFIGKHYYKLMMAIAKL